MISQQFNKWTVQEFAGKNKTGNFLYKCVCECGNTAIVPGSNLRKGKSTQCKSCSSKINGRLGLDAMAKQHLYMVGCEGFLKVGSTDNVERRVKDLRNSCPYPIEVLYIGIDEGFTEPAWHKALSEYRIHGEWFAL